MSQPPGSTGAPAIPTPAVPPSSGWRTFTTSDGQLSFDYPSAWTVQDPAGEAPQPYPYGLVLL
ncbi:hypothetical protein [Pseudarthrobacter albicanus]|uniref:hypothetical protein n=1 Tax=Pseudarthrobacter albicanus TaxID=2823873 RepID=UPI001BA6185A|nr:hypothetical protein [Pseudarthrobacter albicanus]